MPKEFHICTIANRLHEYAQMKDSFIRAGFTEDRCIYSLFDNSVSNIHDPYRVIGDMLESSSLPHIIFCHQDVRLDQGNGYDQLLQQLANLSGRAPSWGIAGNSGFAETGPQVTRITDPHGSFNSPGLPRQVYSLDENFFIVKSGARFKPTPTLSGFHLYATDLCFNAMIAGRTCHVIDFHLTHLSGGSPSSDAFTESLARLIEAWNPRLIVGIAKTPTWFALRLSRYAFIRQALLKPNFERRLRAGRIVFIPRSISGVARLLLLTVKFVTTAALRKLRFIPA